MGRYKTLRSGQGLITGITKDGKYQYSLPDPVLDKLTGIIYLNWRVEKI